MQQIKIFKSVDTETDDLEKQINRFIRKNNIRVLSITGNLAAAQAPSGGAMSSFSAGDVLIIVLYEIDQPGT
ncbi:MAG: hypothetical protein AAFU85_18405 [Planctomycetota bacterium]